MRLQGIFSILSLLIFSASTYGFAEECNAKHFGVASDYNLFVLRELEHHDTDTEGRVAVGGSASFRNYSVGAKISDLSAKLPWALVVGQKLYFTDGSIKGGHIAVGEDFFIPANSVSHAGGIYERRPIDFVEVEKQLLRLSAQFAALNANGSVETVAEGKEIRLTGKGKDLNVFNLPGAALTIASFLSITVPDGASVLINVDGNDIKWADFGFKLTGVTQSKIVYHFPQARLLEMTHIGVLGTVLAPQAYIDFTEGRVEGLMIAKQLRGNGQINLSPPTICVSQFN